METYEVKILGQRYKMKSEEGQEYIEKLAQFVNEKIKDIQKNTKNVAAQNLAVLAAINIADNLFKNQERENKAKREVRERIRRILKMIRKSDDSSEG